MSDVTQYHQIKHELITNNVVLVAVSKTKPVSAIQQLYDVGQRDFGENKVQEMQEKAAQLPTDIRWHLIGHLQSNKVKYIAPYVYMVHSIDSLKLLQEVDKRATQHNRTIDCLLQVHIAEEETKFGLDRTELRDLLESAVYQSMAHVCIRGLMGMATFTDDKEQVDREFRGLNSLFQQIKTDYFADDNRFDTLSMGMSGDYRIAVAAGSTMVRIGSLLFGSR